MSLAERTLPRGLRYVATIFKSRGTVGPGSTDAGTVIPLAVVDKRLARFQVSYHGAAPRAMWPQSGYYEHVVIVVTELDDSRSGRFPQRGFYQVVGLRVRDAGFLFQPP